MISALLIGALLCASPSPAPASASAPSSPAKLEKIHKLLTMTGADQIGRNMLKALQAQMPATQADAVSKVIKPEDIIELVAGVYDRHFTEKDIDGLIQFYGTPLGKRLVEESPGIAQESMQLGQRYAMDKLQALQNKSPSSDAPAAK